MQMHKLSRTHKKRKEAGQKKQRRHIQERGTLTLSFKPRMSDETRFTTVAIVV